MLLNRQPRYLGCYYRFVLVMKKVSVIIPVYNVAPVVEQSLKSALNQTYSNIEYLIVNDCSTDNSMDVVKLVISEEQYIGKDVHIIEHEVNKGLSAARNSGMSRASGEYVFFMDSDDVIVQDCIETQVDTIERYDADMTDFCLNVIGGRNIFREVTVECCISDKEEIMASFFRGKMHFSAWNKLVKKSLLDQYAVKFEEGLIYEDWVWTFQLLPHVNSIAFSPRKTYSYIIRPNSITTAAVSIEKIRKQYDSRIYIMQLLAKYIEESSGVLKREAIKNLNSIRFRTACRLMVVNVDKGIKDEYYIQIGENYRSYNRYGLKGILLFLPFEAFYTLFDLPYNLYRRISRRI